MDRTKGVSLAKGPVGIIGAVLLAGGILGLLMGSTDFAVDAPNGDVTGGTFLGIEGNGWTWLLFAGAGLILLMSAPMHWGAKTMAMVVGLVMAAAAIIAIVDGSDVFGIFAANGMTVLAFGAAAVALLVVAMLPRVGRRRRRSPSTATAASSATAASPSTRRRRRRTGARSARRW